LQAKLHDQNYGKDHENDANGNRIFVPKRKAIIPYLFQLISHGKAPYFLMFTYSIARKSGEMQQEIESALLPGKSFLQRKILLKS